MGDALNRNNCSIYLILHALKGCKEKQTAPPNVQSDPKKLVWRLSMLGNSWAKVNENVGNNILGKTEEWG